MAFKKIQRSSISAETPEALYRDYKNRQIEGLLSHQADIIREYTNNAKESPDVALQLPTGSGKTLVGLLIGEWRLRRFKERAVYVCPTTQLVHQVVEQSNNKYGIKANSFVGSQREYSPKIKTSYNEAETIAVTNYSSLFNTNSFFKNAEIIIFDDAHAAENYIAKYWSILIERHKKESLTLFNNLVSVLKGTISDRHYERLISYSSDVKDRQWVEKIPTPKFNDILPELSQIFDTNIGNETDLQYPWSVLKDHLFACHMYVSYDAMLLRPWIPPTLTHQPFSNAQQRIYMSATLGEGGDLERILGVENIQRLPILEGWDRQGIGRRLFFFPEMSLGEQEALQLAVDMIKETERTLVLVPDNRTAENFKNLITENSDYKTFNARDIEKSKKPFISENKAVAVVANRYDGIDLVGDECRLLIIKGLPKATNLQEKFLITRMLARILYDDRILTRIVQAVGRCTRSATDYATVVIIGDDLKSFLDKNKRDLFHPEIQAELKFGVAQSDVKKAVFIDNLRIFLKHEEEWNEAEKDILYQRDLLQQSKLPGINGLKDTVIHEVKYQYALWNGDFETAVDECRSVLNSLSGKDVEGYRAFWNYLAGSAARLAADKGISSLERVARDFFKRAAASATEGIPWLYELSRFNTEDRQENQADVERLTVVIEELEKQLLRLGTANNNKFDKEVKFIVENLNKTDSKDHKSFEQAHQKLGCLLGYETGKEDLQAEPDVWWMAGNDFCIVFEDHSTEDKAHIESADIGANKLRQVSSHPDWIKKNLSLAKDAQIIPVLVTPFKKISTGTEHLTKDACYWNQEEFIFWANQAISVVRSLRASFPGEADLEWRKRAMQEYKDAKIDPASLAQKLLAQKLSDLPQG